MMENTLKNDSDLEKQTETTAESIKGQGGPEAAEQLKKTQDELTEAKDKYLRLYAEFDNYRRRTAKEKLELIQSANEDLIILLLPVLDDFARADKAFADKKDKAAEGFFLIENKFKKILENAGVKTMDTKEGSDFNPDLHEAVTQIPVDDDNLKGKVVSVLESGYFLNEKVIRHAKVVVGT